jgi:hypothetical protein
MILEAQITKVVQTMMNPIKGSAKLSKQTNPRASSSLLRPSFADFPTEFDIIDNVDAA